jgi:hypothetical protein
MYVEYHSLNVCIILYRSLVENDGAGHWMFNTLKQHIYKLTKINVWTNFDEPRLIDWLIFGV